MSGSGISVTVVDSKYAPFNRHVRVAACRFPVTGSNCPKHVLFPARYSRSCQGFLITEVRGMVAKLTSYSGVSGSTAVNEVQMEYNDFRQLVTE